MTHLLHVDAAPSDRPASGSSPALDDLVRLAGARCTEPGLRTLPADVAAAVARAGFPQHFVPTRWGGDEGSFLSVFCDTVDVARADASTAWCAAIAATVGRMATFLPDAGQAAVWSSGPDTPVAGALVPAGTATAAADGWQLAGRWAYVSGVHSSAHTLLSCRVPVAGKDELRFLLVPRSAYRIETTWKTAGMRATGSDTVVVEDVHVPADHSFPTAELITGRPGGSPCQRPPLAAVSGLTFAAPLLGAARAALDAWIDDAPRRRARADATVDLTLARSAVECDVAESLLRGVAERADKDAAWTERTVATAQRDQTYAAELLAGVVDRLVRTAGTSAFQESHPLQRYWRDVVTGASHAVLQWEPAARRYAGALLADR